MMNESTTLAGTRLFRLLGWFRLLYHCIGNKRPTRNVVWCSAEESRVPYLPNGPLLSRKNILRKAAILSSCLEWQMYDAFSVDFFLGSSVSSSSSSSSAEIVDRSLNLRKQSQPIRLRFVYIPGISL